MKRTIVSVVGFAAIMVGTMTQANAANISILWDNTFDSAVIDNVKISNAGTYDISLFVSEIEMNAPGIFELQFDLVAPNGWLFSAENQTYGSAVSGWTYLAGGVTPGGPNIYREFSSEFGPGDAPLQEGLLVDGITLTIPTWDPLMDEILKFDNIGGAGAELLNFSDLKISAVPIPGALWLLASGVIGILGLRRRKRI
ncbi:MAG: hypothetical protein HKP58_03060 [Desulfatitalea sp.]|nr:VPLPA-CTERM sorting domain-containing protein [Desulfatitalea sp.]NNJ99371.1 hypothetical protein [Desulfatitalea sp.]